MIDIYPRIGERAFVCGKTGSGKTFGSLKMLRRFQGKNQIEILATKEDETMLSLPVPIVTRLSQVAKYRFPEYPVVIYYPEGSELADPELLDNWCQWVYDRKNTVAYIDELTQVCQQTKPLPGFLNMYTRGRSQGVTAIAATQRPVGIPKIVYTEAESFYKFYLTDKKDRQRVAEFSHPKMVEQVSDKHGLHYYSPSRSNDVYYIKSL